MNQRSLGFLIEWKRALDAKQRGHLPPENVTLEVARSRGALEEVVPRLESLGDQTAALALHMATELEEPIAVCLIPAALLVLGGRS